MSAGRWALIAGGGTAGHVLPGLAIAQALCRMGHERDELLFVGSARGVEREVVPEAGFEIVLLPGRGIQRRLTLANVGAAIGLVRAFFTARRLVRRERPRVVVAMGGYASVPCAIAAAFARVPIVVAEQNAVPGLANRLVARYAARCVVAFPDTGLPDEIVTGNPVREEIGRVGSDDRAAARVALAVPAGRRLLVVFGGSLGARRLNHALLDAMPVLGERADVAVRHIGGTRDHDELTARVPELVTDAAAYELLGYEHDMPTTLAAADLVVCRSGATSVAELSVLGLPSVLVPLPGAPGDHQTANARVLSDAGAAILVPDDELDGDRLAAEIGGLLDDPRRLEDMARSARALGRPDAGNRVAVIVEEVAA